MAARTVQGSSACPLPLRLECQSLKLGPRSLRDAIELASFIDRLEKTYCDASETGETYALSKHN
jgi:hypothetical protein